MWKNDQVSIFGLDNNGDLVVAEATGTAFEVVKKYHVAESATWAHPVPTPRGLLIRDATTLALLKF